MSEEDYKLIIRNINRIDVNKLKDGILYTMLRDNFNYYQSRCDVISPEEDVLPKLHFTKQDVLDALELEKINKII